MVQLNFISDNAFFGNYTVEHLGCYHQSHFINTSIQFTETTPVQCEQTDSKITEFYLTPKVGL